MDVFKEILEKRKNRMIAIVLTEWEDDSDDFRKVFLDQVNDYFDLCVDVMNSLDDGKYVLNEEYFNKLDEIHEAVTRG